jgi:hypothetical protein
LTGKCFSLTGKYFRWPESVFCWPTFLITNKYRKVWKIISQKVNSRKQTWWTSVKIPINSIATARPLTHIIEIRERCLWINFPFVPNNSANIVHMFAESLHIPFDNELVVYWPNVVMNWINIFKKY